MRSSALFFSRGRGRGHALPDIEVLEHLMRLALPLDLSIVSYSTGAATFREAGYPVLDLGLPDTPPFLEILVRAGRVIAEARPTVVIAHEEFAVLPAAKACGLPTIFIVEFFPAPHSPSWQESLAYADDIIFIERPGIFAEPAVVKGRVNYVGPLLKSMSKTRDHRLEARRELGVSPDSRLVSVIPGSWATEARMPLLDLVVPAFQLLEPPDKTLLWVAGHDYDHVRERFRGDAQLRCVPHYSPIETVMVASDVVLTKGNRGTIVDASSLGIPSISISDQLNFVDETIVPRIPSNVALVRQGIDPGFLAATMARLLSRAAPPPNPDYQPGGAKIVAAALAQLLSQRTEATQVPMVR